MYPDTYDLNYDDGQTVAFFSLPFEVFNNWSAHRVRLWDRDFATAEHAYQFAKFRDVAPDVAAQIANAPSPWAAFQLSRAHRGQTPADWDDRKVAIMTEVIRAKVEQHEDVRERLLATKSRTIAENSPWDSFWGIGSNGDGQNMVGAIYMQVRAELQSER